MIKRLLTLTLILCALVLCTSAFAESYNDPKLDLKLLEARDIFNEFTLIPEGSIPRSFVSKARAILLFPNTVKGGFLVAARFGQGVVLVRDQETDQWSPPAFFRISGGGFGFQAGASWTDQILLAKSETAVLSFLQRRFALSGNLAAAVGPWGRQAELMSDWQFGYTMFSYARSKGLFAAAATDGTVLSYDTRANERYYGPGITVEDILFNNRVYVTPAASELISAIDNYTPQRYAQAKTNPYVQQNLEPRR
jgi:lipid-binding SYLF domain-containing protein